MYLKYTMNVRIEDLTKDETDFLLSWEDVYKKGIVTFWVLYYLSQKQYDAGTLYTLISANDASLNEHSMYRLLRRLYDVGLLEQTRKEGRNKYYTISEKGKNILNTFTARNIAPLSHTIRSSS